MYESGKTTTLWNYLILAGQRRTSGTLYKGALRMWLRLSVCNRQGLAVLVLSLALIHRSAWNRNSANFASIGFSTVGGLPPRQYGEATLKNDQPACGARR